MFRLVWEILAPKRHMKDTQTVSKGRFCSWDKFLTLSFVSYFFPSFVLFRELLIVVRLALNLSVFLGVLCLVKTDDLLAN